jgi:hypothetical protein
MHSNLPLHVLAVDLDLTSELVDAVDALRTLWLLLARSVTHEVPLAAHENLMLVTMLNLPFLYKFLSSFVPNRQTIKAAP